MDNVPDSSSPNRVVSERLFQFIGLNERHAGAEWEVVSQRVVSGPDWPSVRAIAVVQGDPSTSLPNARWVLRGVTSNRRYATAQEDQSLRQRSAAMDRSESLCGALIPIRKNDAWWAMSQDDRRSVFEDRSKHTELGLRYLPQIARRLHHCRDLATREPFDFLTYFDYAPEYESAFDDLCAALRASPEWSFVDWEIDIRRRRIR